MVLFRNLGACKLKKAQVEEAGVTNKGVMNHKSKPTLDILELVIQSKKKVLGVFTVTYEIYTRYSDVLDVEHKKRYVYRSVNFTGFFKT